MAKEKPRFEGTKIVTPIFRASYLNVFEPKAYEEGAPEKYSVQMIFDKKTDMKDMKDKLAAICTKAWGKEKSKWPKNFISPFRDGDELDDGADEKQKAIYAGCVFANADSKEPPGVYDRQKNDIIDKREFFSGCYARASLFAVPYQDIGGRGDRGRSGVKLYLQGIQMVEKGEPLGRPSSRDDFDEVEGGESEASSDDSDDIGF